MWEKRGSGTASPCPAQRCESCVLVVYQSTYLCTLRRLHKSVLESRARASQLQSRSRSRDRDRVGAASHELWTLHLTATYKSFSSHAARTQHTKHTTATMATTSTGSVSVLSTNASGTTFTGVPSSIKDPHIAAVLRNYNLQPRLGDGFRRLRRLARDNRGLTFLLCCNRLQHNLCSAWPLSHS